MFKMSNVLHRIVVYGSFQQTQDELFDLSHLKEKMLQYVDPITLNQLKVAAINIFEKKKEFCFIRNVFGGATN